MKTVIEMAREVYAGEPESLYGRTDYVVMTKFELERFAALVRAEAVERERKAIIQQIPGGYSVDPQWVCDMIRARNNL